MEDKLSKIYYDPDHLWTGHKAIKMLRKESKEPLKAVKSWLAKQAIWQIHLRPPKHIDHPHFYVTKTNKIHQADLLYLTHDKIYQNTFKYVLNVIDIASEFKASRPLKTKKASEIASMLADIYKKGPLKWPEELHLDSGTEFKGEVNKLMKDHNVTVRRAVTKYNHNHTAFVENFNRILSQRLYKLQDAQELNDPTKDSRIWVKHLYKIVSGLNNTKLVRIKTTPSKAIKLKQVPQHLKAYLKEEILAEDGLYRYLYQPGELEGGQSRRATDMIWSWDTFRLDRVISNPGQRVLYYLAEGPERAFVAEELMLIPENTEPPPDSVKSW